MAGYRGGFGGGFGGGNQMQQLMKQAQKMQEQMAKAQEVVNGKKAVQSVTIKPEAVDPDDIEMLEDLIMAALNNAYDEAEELYNEKMGQFGGAGGLF